MVYLFVSYLQVYKKQVCTIYWTKITQIMNMFCFDIKYTCSCKYSFYFIKKIFYFVPIKIGKKLFLRWWNKFFHWKTIKLCVFQFSQLQKICKSVHLDETISLLYRGTIRTILWILKYIFHLCLFFSISCHYIQQKI